MEEQYNESDIDNIDVKIDDIDNIMDKILNNNNNKAKNVSNKNTESASKSKGSANYKNSKVRCIGCGNELELDHPGIKCVQCHNICLDCSKGFVNLVISEPTIYLPLKCQECKIELNPSNVFRTCTIEQEEKLHEVMLQVVISKGPLQVGESLWHCQFCNYFDYLIDSNHSELMIRNCPNENCKKISCLYCKAEIVCPIIKTQDEFTLIEPHTKCPQMYKLLKEFEIIIQNSLGVPCPQCCVLGRKDVQGCNHMVCNNCETEWCYFCGKKAAELDMELPGNFYSHFNDWKIRESRCPTYLYEVSEIDEKWPSDSAASLEYFHSQRTLRELKLFTQRVGDAVYAEMKGNFSIVANSGFTDNDVISVNLNESLFKRQNPKTNTKSICEIM